MEVEEMEVMSQMKICSVDERRKEERARQQASASVLRSNSSRGKRKTHLSFTRSRSKKLLLPIVEVESSNGSLVFRSLKDGRVGSTEMEEGRREKEVRSDGSFLARQDHHHHASFYTNT